MLVEHACWTHWNVIGFRSLSKTSFRYWVFHTDVLIHGKINSDKTQNNLVPLIWSVVHAPFPPRWSFKAFPISSCWASMVVCGQLLEVCQLAPAVRPQCGWSSQWSNRWVKDRDWIQLIKTICVLSISWWRPYHLTGQVSTSSTVVLCPSQGKCMCV